MTYYDSGWPTKETDEELTLRIRKLRDRRYASTFKKKMRALTRKARKK